MSGIIVYQGPSTYDGKPIVVILVKPSSKPNSKTGAVVQQYIVRSDVSPMDASRIGSDYSICGNCPHRGVANPKKCKGTADNRTCYVTLFQGPTIVYKAFKHGAYPMASPEQIAQFVRGHIVRLGAYGDPAAVPHGVNDHIIGAAQAYTAYTHGHSVADTLGDNAASYRMVSADSKADAIAAHDRGYRTFRVIPIAQSNDALLKNEIMCPSDRGVQCIDCKLCNGQLSINAKSIAIIAHGTSRNKVK